jgi:uncharacterized protein YndB with AHSA1/START domain
VVVHKRSSHTFGNALARSAAGPQRVWELLADGRRWPEWSASVEWAVVEGELAPGGLVTVKRRHGRQTAFRIEAAEQPRRLALLLTFGPAAWLRIEWTLEPDGTGTAIRQTVESGGALRRWLTDPQARRGAAAWADDVARLAERAQFPTP